MSLTLPCVSLVACHCKPRHRSDPRQQPRPQRAMQCSGCTCRAWPATSDAACAVRTAQALTPTGTRRLDGKHVVFGQVLDGMEVVRAIESVGSRTGETAFPVLVSACGELPQASASAPPSRTLPCVAGCWLLRWLLRATMLLHVAMECTFTKSRGQGTRTAAPASCAMQFVPTNAACARTTVNVPERPACPHRLHKHDPSCTTCRQRNKRSCAACRRGSALHTATAAAAAHVVGPAPAQQPRAPWCRSMQAALARAAVIAARILSIGWAMCVASCRTTCLWAPAGPSVSLQQWHARRASKQSKLRRDLQGVVPARLRVAKHGATGGALCWQVLSRHRETGVNVRKASHSLELGHIAICACLSHFAMTQMMGSLTASPSCIAPVQSVNQSNTCPARLPDNCMSTCGLVGILPLMAAITLLCNQHALTQSFERDAVSDVASECLTSFACSWSTNDAPTLDTFS